VRAIVSVVPAASRFDLSGRVALVTGASRGIGSSIAEILAEHGAQVVLSSRKQSDLDQEADRINGLYPERATAIAAHAGRPEDLERLVQQVMERFSRIDILVNNAATNPYFGPLLGADLGAWDKTFEVNLRGVFALTRLVYRASMETHGGAIVNVASIGGLRPGVGLGVYNITKAGVIMLTRQLAKELGGSIRVNAVAPGLIKTRFAQGLWGNQEILDRVLAQNPMGRIGVPDEVGAAVLFLVSDAASYVNGEVLVIDGGGGEV
jgi:NAD(P)-dependent dehydrogenase (short-subunit alcohol dehydrogenase family)